MTEPKFIHLRVHTAYSLSEGAMKVPALIKKCQKPVCPRLPWPTPQEKPYLIISDLEQVNEGIIALSAGVEGQIGRLLTEGRFG
jgi:DNA polymerase III alpha subunit